MPMKLKLNDAEINTILSMCDNFLIDYPQHEEIEMEIATIKSIIKKIGDNVQYKHHNFIDDFVISLRETYMGGSEQ